MLVSVLIKIRRFNRPTSFRQSKWQLRFVHSCSTPLLITLAWFSLFKNFFSKNFLNWSLKGIHLPFIQAALNIENSWFLVRIHLINNTFKCFVHVLERTEGTQICTVVFRLRSHDSLEALAPLTWDHYLKTFMSIDYFNCSFFDIYTGRS